jgi:hypothetical protein
MLSLPKSPQSERIDLRFAREFSFQFNSALTSAWWELILLYLRKCNNEVPEQGYWMFCPNMPGIQELDFRNPYPKTSYAYRSTSDSTCDKLSSMSHESERQRAEENRSKKP